MTFFDWIRTQLPRAALVQTDTTNGTTSTHPLTIRPLTSRPQQLVPDTRPRQLVPDNSSPLVTSLVRALRTLLQITWLSYIRLG